MFIPFFTVLSALLVGLATPDTLPNVVIEGIVQAVLLDWALTAQFVDPRPVGVSLGYVIQRSDYKERRKWLTLAASFFFPTHFPPAQLISGAIGSTTSR